MTTRPSSPSRMRIRLREPDQASRRCAFAYIVAARGSRYGTAETGAAEMHTPIDAAHSPIVRAAVEGTLHGWQRLSRFQAAIAYPTMKAAATALGLHVTALTGKDPAPRIRHQRSALPPRRPRETTAPHPARPDPVGCP